MLTVLNSQINADCGHSDAEVIGHELINNPVTMVCICVSSLDAGDGGEIGHVPSPLRIM